MPIDRWRCLHGEKRPVELSAQLFRLSARLRNMRAVTIIGFGLFVCLAAFGQASESSFEVADVHPSPRATALPFRVFSYGGRFEIHNATMVDLIRTAYTVDEYKILGGPNWIEYDRFDIIAKAPPNTGREALKPMLRTLLTERFNLQVHQGTEPVLASALTLGKGKLKMKEADGSGEQGCHRQIPSPLISLSCHNITMEEFAAALKTLAGDYVPKLVMDSTGLKGGWDFDLKFTPYERISAPGYGGTSLSDAIDQQLGLKLEGRQLPADVLIVESVNRKSTDNSPDIDAKLPPSPPAEFEVASVKPAPPDARRMPLTLGVLPGGLVQLSGVSLKVLVSAAWNLNVADEIPGAPKWLDSALFDITAKVLRSRVPENGGPSVQELAPEFQALLKDRFKMEVHFEDRLVPAYTLGATKPKLKNSDPSIRTRCRNTAQGGVVATPFGILPQARLIACQNITMSQLAEQLQILAPENTIHYPIVDGTGLDGGFDFSFRFDPPIIKPINWTPPAFGEPERTSILKGVEKLGLKLEAQKRSYPVMVIDHIEQKPTDN